MTCVSHARLFSMIASFLLVFSTPGTKAFAEGLRLSDPSADDLALIAYSMAGAEVPVAEWAAADRSVTAKDEFARRTAAAGVQRRLSDRFQQVKDVRDLTVNLRSSFGEYNDVYSEFDFDINDGTYIQFNTNQNTSLQLHLVNGGLAQAWQVTRPDAEKLLRLTQGDRSVVLSLRLHLISVNLPLYPNGSIVLDVNISEYDIVGANKPTRLGHVVVK